MINQNIITLLTLTEYNGEMENGEYYKWWKLKIRDTDLMFTVEYTDKGDEITSYWEVNDYVLKNPSKDDILNLIRILSN